LAIKIDLDDERFGIFKDAYVKLIYYNGNKKSIWYSMQVYKDKQTSDNDTKNIEKGKLWDLHIKNYTCTFDLTSFDDIIGQCYNDFKKKFSDIYKGDC